ncbi:MAG: DUF2344 domain-containing protein [Chloroflexia bacterium]|nr:DUF2344 domain-containing protein [Chloroflexia bacterium]
MVSFQRLYMNFARGLRLRFLSHLDMMRLWEHAFRRAELPLHYSQGYHPQPRLSLALPLAVGMVAAAEWIEIGLDGIVPLIQLCEQLSRQMPQGIVLRWFAKAEADAPSLASMLQSAEYLVPLEPAPPQTWTQEQVAQFLEAESWPMREQHKGKWRTRDLRQEVKDLSLGPWTAEQGVLRMVLWHRPQISGRPDRILHALNLQDYGPILRQELYFQDLPLGPREVWCLDERDVQNPGRG